MERRCVFVTIRPAGATCVGLNGQMSTCRDLGHLGKAQVVGGEFKAYRYSVTLFSCRFAHIAYANKIFNRCSGVIRNEMHVASGSYVEDHLLCKAQVSNMASCYRNPLSWKCDYISRNDGPLASIRVELIWG